MFITNPQQEGPDARETAYRAAAMAQEATVAVAAAREVFTPVLSHCATVVQDLERKVQLLDAVEGNTGIYLKNLHEMIMYLHGEFQTLSQKHDFTFQKLERAHNEHLELYKEESAELWAEVHQLKVGLETLQGEFATHQTNSASKFTEVVQAQHTHHEWEIKCIARIEEIFSEQEKLTVAQSLLDQNHKSWTHEMAEVRSNAVKDHASVQEAVSIVKKVDQNVCDELTRLVKFDPQQTLAQLADLQAKFGKFELALKTKHQSLCEEVTRQIAEAEKKVLELIPGGGTYQGTPPAQQEISELQRKIGNLETRLGTFEKGHNKFLSEQALQFAQVQNKHKDICAKVEDMLANPPVIVYEKPTEVEKATSSTAHVPGLAPGAPTFAGSGEHPRMFTPSHYQQHQQYQQHPPQQIGVPGLQACSAPEFASARFTAFRPPR